MSVGQSILRPDQCNRGEVPFLALTRKPLVHSNLVYFLFVLSKCPTNNSCCSLEAIIQLYFRILGPGNQAVGPNYSSTPSIGPSFIRISPMAYFIGISTFCQNYNRLPNVFVMFIATEPCIKCLILHSNTGHNTMADPQFVYIRMFNSNNRGAKRTFCYATLFLVEKFPFIYFNRKTN